MLETVRGAVRRLNAIIKIIIKIIIIIIIFLFLLLSSSSLLLCAGGIGSGPLLVRSIFLLGIYIPREVIRYLRAVNLATSTPPPPPPSSPIKASLVFVQFPDFPTHSLARSPNSRDTWHTFDGDWNTATGI